MYRLLLVLALFFLPAADVVPLDRLQRVDGVSVVPDRFLRSWDPVTVFFPTAVGPAQGGPEDAPGRLVTLVPAKPGAWVWLDAKTLQFRPTEMWTPLQRETVTLNGNGVTLVPLLPLPVSTGPADDPAGIADLDTFALTFAQPVDRAALARLLTIELRPLPGISGEAAQPLTAQDFDIKPVDQTKGGEKQTYLVVLHRPIPDGRMAILRLRLADEPGLDDPIFELRLRSAAPFALSDFLCADGFNHTVQDGVTLCTPDDSAQPGPRGISLQFAGAPEAMDIVRARQVLRISPPVGDLAVKAQGNSLLVTGRFLPDIVYALHVESGLKDTRGRLLTGESGDRRFAFAPSIPALRWDASQGIVERNGPQMVPLRGHGYARADLRIFPIDPLSRDFWPFPSGVVTQDDHAPPLPGNEPAHWTDSDPISRDDLQARIASLGSPAVSELVDLPIQRGGVDAKFGLDLAPQFSRIAGSGQPGAYLVGLRPVDGANRVWLRVQVTDLSFTAVEEADRVRFSVTSLATAQPVAGAEIRLEGIRGDSFDVIARGVTAADGSFVWQPRALPADADDKPQLKRVVVTKGADQLVLEPGQNAPPRYADGTWTARPRGNWLNWAASGAIADRRPKPSVLCHVFTERPIYRPEEPVLIAGMVRRYAAGSLSYASGGGSALITGPDNQEFRVPVTLDDVGGFHVRFDQKTEATGDYALKFEPQNGDACGAITFKKEAYRLPTFEVLLNAPPRATLDAPFQVGLIARWFAGGLLSDRPATWRVTQFPYVWTPPGRDGFLFSSDARFGSDEPFRSTPVMNRTGTTDAGGSAQITLDPTIEPTAQPREYVVEATVTGNDDIQVRSVQHVVALPPFVLGIKQDRYLEHAGAIDPDIIATDAEGKPVAGLAMTARLVHRNWNSVLQASDFAQGSAKYETEVIDQTIAEQKITSTADVQHLHFAAPDAGVYLVELEATDKIGRTQLVKVDLFMAGDTPVTWSRPPSQAITVTTTKDAYDPGETAEMVIQSPFQSGRALAISEQPEGPFRYDWVDIANGYGRYPVPIRKQQVPRLAVHFLLMRGRLPGAPTPTAPFDQGKPTTLAATKWVKVTPVDNQVKVTFDAPATARPAQEIDVILHLADYKGAPMAGEATFWMVDQAVLSLAKEQPLDPLPRFIVDRPAKAVARDSRNMAFGVIPLVENPGGDEAGDFGMENISVRRNFTPIPIYVPRVKFGPDGTAKVHVKLPDTLTVYMLRAKAISGPDRFGFGTGQMRIRQPVVAQPALPRFVRPGDTFGAGLIARVVEGPGGAAHALVSADGITLTGDKQLAFNWSDTRPARVDFPVTVPQNAPQQDTAHIRFLVQRDADHASDSVEIALPIRPDRPATQQRDVATIGAGASRDLPMPGDIRPGSYSRTVTLAADPIVVKLVGGLNALLLYPYGCTEQRIALGAAELALSPYGSILDAAGLHDRLTADIASTALVIRQNTDEDGLVAYWPHTKGDVLLTSWAYSLLATAKAQKIPIDQAQLDRMTKVLEQALRSDYPHFIAGEGLRERVAALLALAQGGDIKPDYVAELARLAAQMPTETLAQATIAVTELPNDTGMVANLMETLWGRVRILARNGQPTYAGLADTGGNPLVLPSEVRSLADTLRAVTKATPNEPRLPLLRNALLAAGTGDGWGNTNATTAALKALAASWAPPGQSSPVAITLPDHTTTGTIAATTPLVSAQTQKPGAIHLENHGTTTLATLVDSTFTAPGPGASAPATQNGFVLTRTLYRVPASGPLQRLDDGTKHLKIGDTIEEADEIVNPEDRTHVAITLPLAAGTEPLNPNIATAPADAAPSAAPTLEPSYASYADDAVTFVYLELPKGTYTLRFRTRAQTSGNFTQPPAQAETMYRPGISGTTSGQSVEIIR